MNATEIARMRLHNQRLTCPTFDSPAEVVRWFGAVQAQEYPAALWGVGQRMVTATEKSVADAMATAQILRTHSMRGTWHFLATEDIRWFLSLTGPRQIAKTSPYYRKLELDESILRRSLDVIHAALNGGGQLTKKELTAALDRAGIVTENLRVSFILMRAESEGLIASGALRGKQRTYALVDDLVPTSHTLEREEALAELTYRYFASHGPATLKDFVWWSGLTVADAKVGLALNRERLLEETVEGQQYWFAPPLPETSLESPAAYLLPPYDEYTVAYSNRSALQHPDHVERTRDPFVNLGPVIVIDGRVSGTWKRTLGKDAVVLEPRPFGSLGHSEMEAVEAAAGRYAAFLRLPLKLA